MSPARTVTATIEVSLLEQCRRTYQAQSRMQRDAPWTPAHVKRLMGLLQIAPYERVYRLRSQLYACEICGPGRAFDELLVDDRHLTTCGGCGASWIVLHL